MGELRGLHALVVRAGVGDLGNWARQRAALQVSGSEFQD
jgi:hypothetical protein